MAAADAGRDAILVRAETSPDDVHGMQRSVGILTTTGGFASHAAVVARGWGIPAVVGASDVLIEGGVVVIGGRDCPPGRSSRSTARAGRSSRESRPAWRSWSRKRRCCWAGRASSGSRSRATTRRATRRPWRSPLERRARRRAAGAACQGLLPAGRARRRTGPLRGGGDRADGWPSGRGSGRARRRLFPAHAVGMQAAVALMGQIDRRGVRMLPPPRSIRSRPGPAHEGDRHGLADEGPRRRSTTTRMRPTTPPSSVAWAICTPTSTHG